MRKVFLAAGLLLMISACHPLRETKITGKLELTQGWKSGINLYDDDKKTPVTLQEGPYNIDFPTKYLPFTDPRIEISDGSGRKLLTMKIPKDKIKDDGTFELYYGDSKSATQFNILGGRREVVLDRKRYAAIRQHCTYTESYSCEEPCTDSNGKSSMCSTTCTREVDGDQDAVHEIRHVKSIYRILFDGADLMNAGAFSGESAVREEDVEIASTSCS